MCQDAINFGAFQFLRDGSHKSYCLLSWIGLEVSAVKRGRAASATLQVAGYLVYLCAFCMYMYVKANGL